MNYEKEKEIEFQRGANIFFILLSFFRLWHIFVFFVSVLLWKIMRILALGEKDRARVINLGSEVMFHRLILT